MNWKNFFIVLILCTSFFFNGFFFSLYFQTDIKMEDFKNRFNMELKVSKRLLNTLNNCETERLGERSKNGK